MLVEAAAGKAVAGLLGAPTPVLRRVVGVPPRSEPPRRAQRRGGVARRGSESSTGAYETSTGSEPAAGRSEWTRTGYIDPPPGGHATTDEPFEPIPQQVSLDPRCVELGRRLFEDPALSGSGERACVDCHDLGAGGIVPGEARSNHPRNATGPYNVPTVFNVAYNQKMSRMLDGVLLIGRAEAGMLHLNAEPTDVGEFCDAIVEELQTVVGTERELRVAKDVPDHEVRLDRKLLRHVLLNLLSNAFKYSSDDSVVSLDVGHDEESIRLTIEDEGIGIPEKERDRLFEAFHRCSNASGIAGNGLGLAVVQRSLEVQGGSIEVDSIVGEGTTFRVRIPFVEDEA